ncbi:MAG: alpha-glucosidase/alpha-galactosidase, partial [Clostridia bacterium]
MIKVTFLGAGSTIFAKNVLGDIILTPTIKNIEIALYDIDSARLNDSYLMLQNILKTSKRDDIKIYSFTNRLEALKDAKYVVNAVQIGGYEPCTVTDFEVPKKFGLRQTIGDTLGVGGVFRALRTIPVLEEFTNDIVKVCPDALFINYTNPMAMLTGYLTRYTKVKSVGLCHSVQVCVEGLLTSLGMDDLVGKTKWEIAGIN